MNPDCECSVLVNIIDKILQDKYKKSSPYHSSCSGGGGTTIATTTTTAEQNLPEKPYRVFKTGSGSKVELSSSGNGSSSVWSVGIGQSYYNTDTSKVQVVFGMPKNGGYGKPGLSSHISMSLLGSIIVSEYNDVNSNSSKMEIDDDDGSGGGGGSSSGGNTNSPNAKRVKKTISVYDCLDKFTEREKLAETESWYCSKCKEHVEAVKKVDLWTTPGKCSVV